MHQDAQLNDLLGRAASGDGQAVDQLFHLFRPRLKRMVVSRMDRRVIGRVDPSDVVQETLMEASRRLAEYAEQPTIAFYPWLRKVALNRLTQINRLHILAQKRSVTLEEPLHTELSDESVAQIADRLAASVESPGAGLQKEETRRRVQLALNRLSESDREVLMLIYLEEMSTTDAAAILEVSDRTVRRRHRLAVERLGRWLVEPSS